MFTLVWLKIMALKKRQNCIRLLASLYLTIFLTPLIIQTVHHFSVTHKYHFHVNSQKEIYKTETHCFIHNFEFASFLAQQSASVDFNTVSWSVLQIEPIAGLQSLQYAPYNNRAPPIA